MSSDFFILMPTKQNVIMLTCTWNIAPNELHYPYFLKVAFLDERQINGGENSKAQRERFDLRILRTSCGDGACHCTSIAVLVVQ